MTTQEMAAILKIIKVSFPHSFKNLTEKDAIETLEVWTMMFEEDNAKIVTEAVKAMITTLKFPPTIADIKEKIDLIAPKHTATLTEMEAWGLVYKAICNSGYDSENRFNQLPQMIQKLVGTPKQLREWGLTENLNVSVVQSNFMRSYKVMAEREEMIRRLPVSCLTLIRQEDMPCLSAKPAEEKDLLPIKLCIVR